MKKHRNEVFKEPTPALSRKRPLLEANSPEADDDSGKPDSKRMRKKVRKIEAKIESMELMSPEKASSESTGEKMKRKKRKLELKAKSSSTERIKEKKKKKKKANLDEDEEMKDCAANGIVDGDVEMQECDKPKKKKSKKKNLDKILRKIDLHEKVKKKKKKKEDRAMDVEQMAPVYENDVELTIDVSTRKILSAIYVACYLAD